MSKHSLLLALLLLAGASACRRSRSDDDPVSYVKKDDATMLAAIEKARGSLGSFRRVLAAPPPGATDFSVKVSFACSDNSREHIWLGEPKLTDSEVTGRVNNEPADVPTIKLGEVVSRPIADVSDWMYVENGVLKGGYTTRVLLDGMSAEERSQTLTTMGLRLE